MRNITQVILQSYHYIVTKTWQGFYEKEKFMANIDSQIETQSN